MGLRVERLILKGILSHKDYAATVFPHLKPTYFKDSAERNLYGYARQFFTDYAAIPSAESLAVHIEGATNLNDDNYAKNLKTLEEINDLPTEKNLEWLTNETEDFCKRRAIEIALLESVEIVQDPKANKKWEAIPSILTEALSVGFDRTVGIELTDDLAKRWENYQNQWNERLAIELSAINEATNGGFPKGTLSVYLAGTGVGKSMTMCSNAAHFVACGRNVLYITCELSDFEVTKRIEANLLDVTVNDLNRLSKEDYVERMAKLIDTVKGRFIVKKFSTSTGNVNDFRMLIDDLKAKRNFVPDAIFVDYINLCTSVRVKAEMGSYSLIKAVAEEIRGFAEDTNTAIISATQVNRDGLDATDFGLAQVSESKALADTVDFMAGLIRPEDFKRSGRMKVKVLKNRFSDGYPVVVVGVDTPKMRLFDLTTKETLQSDDDVYNIPEAKPTNRPKFQLEKHKRV